MSIQKYRADEAGPAQANGGVPYYTKWIGGPTLALIRNCKIENLSIGARTVYITGEPDTWTSIPAACRYRGKRVVGYVTSDENREYVFRAQTREVERLGGQS